MELLNVGAQYMGNIVVGYTGLTFTAGRTKPYAAWVNGLIIWYAATEMQAADAVLRKGLLAAL